MRQSRDNSVYMVVSPRYGTWEAIFKNIDFKFYECNMFVADAAVCEHMFAKCVTQNDEEYFVAGKKVKSLYFIRHVIIRKLRRQRLIKDFCIRFRNWQERRF